jgi:hypothetical protein
MKFTNNDMETLLKIYGGDKITLKEDLPQIELAADMTAYSFGTNESNERIITRIGAIRKIGRGAWISGLVRSAFHRTAMRYVDDSDESRGYVYFDSSNIFK